jgi:hypothetical protein
VDHPTRPSPARGIALRYGIFGDPTTAGQAVRAQVPGRRRRRRSFILDDAAGDGKAALSTTAAVYNIVTTFPGWRRAREIIGAKPPQRLRLLARPRRGAGMAIEPRGASSKAKRGRLRYLLAASRRRVRKTDRKLCAAIGSGQCRTGRVEFRPRNAGRAVEHSAQAWRLAASSSAPRRPYGEFDEGSPRVRRHSRRPARRVPL